MRDRRRLLKVKIKSLAVEARIIRMEERRTTGTLRTELYWHRIHVVRKAAREALLAYGFIRGRSLASIEPKAATAADAKEVKKLVERFGIVLQHPDESWTQYTARKAEQEQQLTAWLEGEPQPLLAVG